MVRRRRAVRIVGPVVRLLLVLLAVAFAARFLYRAILTEGFSPAMIFGLLVLAATLALLWRAVLHVRKSLRRLRT
jgi:hypothetical protein